MNSTHNNTIILIQKMLLKSLFTKKDCAKIHNMSKKELVPRTQSAQQTDFKMTV